MINKAFRRELGSKRGLTPSPLRGEGRDEEWFDSEHNAINLTLALSLKRRGR
jgi:hypothetical protein